MNHDEALQKVKTILETDFRIPTAKITLDATFRGSFGMDSLDAVDFIYLVTKTFQLSADISAFRELHTLGKVVDYVVAEVGKHASPET